MRQPENEQIEALLKDTGCVKNIQALLSNPNDQCCAVDKGYETFFECHHEHPQLCKYIRHFGYVFFCRCPLALHIRKEFERISSLTKDINSPED